MKTLESHVIGAYEAKTHFSELLERVALGEEITITRHGTPVARLIPARAARSEADRQKAIDAMRRLASRHRLDGLRVEDLRIEGRR